MKFLSGFEFRLLLLWLIGLAILIPILYGLSTSPRFLLQMEERQPALSYAKGLEFQKQGRKTEAIAEFEKGWKFFQKLYEESQNENHRKQAVLCMLAVANLLTDSQDLNRALEIYNQAIQWEPELSEGQPYLSRGHVLRGLGSYAEAVDSYTEAIKRGDALLILDTLYARGLSLLELGKINETADDWYFYLRYHAGNCSMEQWNAFSRFPDCSNPRRLVIWGNAALSLNHLENARKDLENYIQNQSHDRFAQYLLAVVRNQPIPSDNGNISLNECFPAGAAAPIRINKTILDLYSSKNETRSLIANLAGEATGTVISEVVINLNQLEIKPTLLVSSQRKEYIVPLELKRGKNLLRIEEKKSKTPNEITKIWLYALQLK